MKRLCLTIYLSASLIAASGPFGPLLVTTRRQHMSTVGRQEWLQNNQRLSWEPTQTAIVVVDMWNVHWCASATTRVAELAVPMQEWVAAARARGVTIIWAPSDCTDFYKNSTARKNTLSLSHVSLPATVPITAPSFPLNTETDGGCDTNCPMGSPWTHQIDTLKIESADFLISADVPVGTQELWNVLSDRKVQNLMYAGVHENMCIMGRPFAIEEVRKLGWSPDRVAVVRELVDVMYTPKDRPYVSHAAGLQLHTEYIEKFWASSVSMYDVLAPSYNVSWKVAMNVV